MNKIILTLSFLFICSVSTAQSSVSAKRDKLLIDSLARHADQKTLEKLFFTDNLLVEKIVKRQYELAVQKTDTTKIIENLITLAKFNILSGDYKNAESHFLKAIYYVSQFPNPKYKALIFIGLGNIYYFQYDFIKAKNHFEEAIKTTRKIKDKALKTQLKSEAKLYIAVIYTDLEMFEEARQIHYESLNENKNTDDQNTKASTILLIGYSYLQEGKPRQAVPYLQKAIRLTPPTSLQLIAEAHGALGRCFLQLKEYKDARSANETAINIYSMAGINHLMNEHLLVKASINLKEQKYLDSTIFIAEKVLGVALKSKASGQIQLASEILYKAYKEKGNMNRALEMKELSDTFVKKLDIAGKSEKVKIKKMRDQLNLETKKYQRSVEEHSLSQKLSQTTILLIILFAFLSALFIFFYYFRKNKKDSDERVKLMAQINQFNRSKHQSSEDDSTILTIEVNNLNVESINAYSTNKLNETDWKILHEINLNPKSTNKELAEKVHLSYDGVVSSLRKMYKIFEVEATNNHRLELLLKLHKISRDPMGNQS